MGTPSQRATQDAKAQAFDLFIQQGELEERLREQERQRKRALRNQLLLAGASILGASMLQGGIAAATGLGTDATFGAKLAEVEAAWELQMVEAATEGIAKQPKLAVDLLERRRPSWNREAQAAQVAGNQRNTIAPQLVIALCNVPESHVEFTEKAQVIDIQ